MHPKKVLSPLSFSYGLKLCGLYTSTLIERIITLKMDLQFQIKEKEELWEERVGSAHQTLS